MSLNDEERKQICDSVHYVSKLLRNIEAIFDSVKRMDLIQLNYKSLDGAQGWSTTAGDFFSE